MTEYEIGRLLAELTGKIDDQTANVQSLRNEVLGYTARLTLAEAAITALRKDVANLQAKDMKHDAVLESGSHDITKVQARLREYETALAEAKRDGARAMIVPAGASGGALLGIVAAILKLLGII